MKKILILGVLLIALVAPLSASAQFGSVKDGNSAIGRLDSVAGSKGAGLNSDINTSISTIIKGALSLVGTIFLALSVYAGILWMTAAGNEEKVTKAKDIITQAVIGLAVTLSAYAITAFVTSKLNSGGSPTPTPSPETEIYCKDKDGKCGVIKTTTCVDDNNFSDSACTVKK